VRILQVIGGGYLPHETTGTQIYVRDLCRSLRARGHDVRVFTRLAGNAFPELAVTRDEWEGVPVTRLTYNFADLDRFELLYSHPQIDAAFDRCLDEIRPDLVNIHHLSCLSTSMIGVARARGIPVVMALHDYWMVCLRGQRIRPDDLGICDVLDRDRCVTCLNKLWPHLLPLSGPRSLWDRLLGRPPALAKIEAWERHMKASLASCDAVTAPSSFHRERFVEWGLDPARVLVAPIGLAADQYKAAARVERPMKHLGYIGSVVPSKGVHVLCDAFRRLARRDLVLHVHGEAPSFHGDTSYLGSLRRSVSPDLDVHFHGRYEHEDLPAILASLDVLVVPSLWWESFCLTAREGALAGLPVVASDLGALEEAVREGIALGFKAGDADDLARALTRVLNEPALRADMRRKAAGIRNLDQSTARMLEIYEAVTDTAAGARLARLSAS
jgi:glycosyltransferase involved in cell wall biosynthesis